MIWDIFIAIAVIYLLILVLVYFAQAKIVYFPGQSMNATPEQAGLSYENVDFQTEDGLNLHGWFIPADLPRATLLFCHGNAGNISNRIESIAQFNSLGLSVFIFDYRGFGQSEGKPDEKGTYLDAEAAWRYLTETRSINPDEIIIFGRSLGGAIASHLAVQVQSKALVIESAFTSMTDIGSRQYPFLPVKLLSRFDYNTLKNIAQVKVPVLVIHSLEDELIPFEHGRKLFAAVNEPKQFLEISGGHNDGFLTSAAEYETGWIDFLDNFAR